MTLLATEDEINTFPELLHSKSHKLAILKGMHFSHMLETTHHPLLKQLHKKFINDNVKPISIFKTKQALLNDKHTVFMVSKEINKVASALNWGTPLGQTFAHWSKQTIKPSRFILGFRKKSSFEQCITPWIIQMWDTGLFQIWRTIGTNEARLRNPIFKNAQSRKQMIQVLKSLPSRNDENEPLSMQQLQGAFYLYFIFLALAILAFIQEKCEDKIR